MVVVRPFRGVRYTPKANSGFAALVCAPYDVITPEAQDDLYRRSEINFVRLELGKQTASDVDSDNRYTRSAATLSRWLDDGILAPDESPSLYVYDEGFEESGRLIWRRGLYALVKLEEWSAGAVLPHERTMARPRADRLALMRATRANLSPILAMYDDPGDAIAETLESAVSTQKPLADFRLDAGLVAAAAERHRLWRVSDAAEIDRICTALGKGPLYIADGHHRYETALGYAKERREAGSADATAAGYVMMHLLSIRDAGIRVLPTHRLIRPPLPVDRQAILSRLELDFHVEAVDVAGLPPERLAATLTSAIAARVSEGPAFAVVFGTPLAAHVVWARSASAIAARLPANRTAAWRSLDVAALQVLVLEEAMGLAGAASGESQVEFTRDAVEATRGVTESAFAAALLLNGTPVRQIIDVAVAGDRMPEKSTYFWPKPVTGLVIYYHHELGWVR